jgi:multiple sugar transport system permease protein
MAATTTTDVRGAGIAQETTRKGISRRQLREWLVAVAFISPWIIGFLLFTGGPIVASFVLSFFRWKIISPPIFNGIDNYVRLFTTDVLFRTSLVATAEYVLILVPLANVIALFLAILLNQKVRGQSFWRSVFYLPAVVSGVAGAVIWMWMYDRDLGVINNLLQMLGLPGANWLYDKNTALGALIARSLWTVGVPMVVYLAALQAMPQTLYEAADLDGAGEWTKFRHVTLPLLTPVIFFNFVIGFIGAIQTFAEPYVMTKGGPENSTLLLGLYLYQTAFGYLQMGYAAAIAWIMFLIIFILTLIQLRLSSFWVYYEA